MELFLSATSTSKRAKHRITFMETFLSLASHPNASNDRNEETKLGGAIMEIFLSLVTRLKIDKNEE